MPAFRNETASGLRPKKLRNLSLSLMSFSFVSPLWPRLLSTDLVNHKPFCYALHTLVNIYSIAHRLSCITREDMFLDYERLDIFAKLRYIFYNYTANPIEIIITLRLIRINNSYNDFTTWILLFRMNRVSYVGKIFYFVTKEDRRNYVLSAILWRTDRVVFTRRRDYEVIKQSHARLLLGRQMFRKRPVTSGAYGRTSGKTTERVDLCCRFLPILLRNVITRISIFRLHKVVRKRWFRIRFRKFWCLEITQDRYHEGDSGRKHATRILPDLFFFYGD